MAYEVEAITPATTPVNSSIQDSGKLREDKVFEPYKVKARSQSPTKTVQTDNTVASPSDPAAVSAPAAESVALSPAMAALARKEQRFLQQQSELKAQQKALEAERAEIAELKAMKAKLAAKDFSGIEEQVPYDDYVKYLLSKQPQSEEAKHLAEISNRIEKIEGTQKQSLEDRMADAINSTRDAVKGVVESNAEFSSIKELGLHEAVVQHILDSWDQDNVELTPEQAAKEVETLLVEQAAKFAGLPKLKAATPAAPAEEKKLPPLKQGITTLTNNMAAAGDAKRPNRPFQGMSDSERWAEARRRAEEKLKQKA